MNGHRQFSLQTNTVQNLDVETRGEWLIEPKHFARIYPGRDFRLSIQIDFALMFPFSHSSGRRDIRLITLKRTNFCFPISFAQWLIGFALVMSVCPIISSECRAQAVPNLQLKGGVVPIQRVEDVIDNWQPNRHVFVKGDIGVGQRQLDELQTWIAQNAPHWTVVLMESAAGERYRAADGRSYEGLDAVEHALGNGLSNRTGFGNWEHPKTGESDGAIFVLFLRDRKFSYFGSDAQDRRGLGESAWMGQLDQPAFRAMRGGGRIVDAAKDTIQSINEQLEKSHSIGS